MIIVISLTFVQFRYVERKVQYYPRPEMIENRPILTFFSHLILVIGVAIVALPVYVTFVASPLAVDEVLQSPMPLLPGSHLIENYPKVLSPGASPNVPTSPVEPTLLHRQVS